MKPAQRDQCQVGVRPRNDKVFFEAMSKVVFRSGMKWEVIEKKWPDFQKAFTRFLVKKIAQLDEADIDRLLKDSRIVRNYRKILATVQNAQSFLDIQKTHGSFAKYLQEISQDGEAALCKTLSKRFSFMGGSTTLFFLRAVGEEMPETTRQWEAAKHG